MSKPSESQRDPRQLHPPDQLPPPQPYRPRRVPPRSPPLHGFVLNPPPPLHFGPGRVPSQPFPLGPPPFPGYPNPPFQSRPYRPRLIRGPKRPCSPFPAHPTISNPKPQIQTTTAAATIITSKPTTTAAAHTDTSKEPTTPMAPTEDTTQIITHPPGTLLLNATIPVTTPYPTTVSSTTSQSLWQKFLSLFG
ncbi:PREDICTED: proline-rich protein 1 [Propithecus coquereli]|uniref:proline-rich protein 1 n=1 Tax=Propithecus coquereli TaxID=379532 RepID=UPI00063F609E|nr:PREDICTED: proline-rich protein 1 [Propithecus coquereli]